MIKNKQFIIKNYFSFLNFDYGFMTFKFQLASQTSLILHFRSTLPVYTFQKSLLKVNKLYLNMLPAHALFLYIKQELF